MEWSGAPAGRPAEDAEVVEEQLAGQPAQPTGPPADDAEGAPPAGPPANNAEEVVLPLAGQPAPLVGRCRRTAKGD